MVRALFAKIKEGVVQMDRFSKKVSLTFNGSSSFKTFFGGTVSMIISITTIIILVVQFITMLKRTSISTNQTK